MKLESTGLSVAITSTLVSPVRNGRSYLGVQNLDPTNNIFVHFGEDAATALNGIQISPGEYLEIAPGLFHDGEVNAIATVGAVNAIILEGR